MTDAKKPFEFRPPPHSKKIEWERARQASWVPRSFLDYVLPVKLTHAINARVDKALGAGWENGGTVTGFKVRDPSHPDKCVYSGMMLVRGDGKVLSGPRNIDAAFFDGKEKTDCSSFFHDQTAEIINGYVKGPSSLEGYMYPGPPADESQAEAALTHSQVAAKAEKKA